MRKFYLTLMLLYSSFAPVIAQTDFPIGTGTTGNGTTGYPCPLQDWDEGSRMQFLFLASELSAAGMTPGNIVSIKYEVTSLGTAGVIEQQMITIGTTSVSSLSTSSWDAFLGATVSTAATNYQPVMGTNTFTFPIPFTWNGTDNILIEICNGEPGNATGTWYTNNPVVPWTTGLPFNGSHTRAIDNAGNLCGTTVTTNLGTQTTRPNVIFSWVANAPCTNPPTPGTAVVNPISVCAGNSVNLSLTGNSYGIGQTYLWETSSSAAGPFTPLSTSSNSPSYNFVAPATSTYYRAAVSCGGNTQHSMPVLLTVSGSVPPAQGISSSPGDTVCAGTQVTLSIPGCSGCVYLWSTGATTTNINVNTSSIYSVSVSNICGVVTASKEIVYNPSPSLSINGTNTICSGTSTTLVASGANTYIWSPATGLNTTSGSTVIATPAATTTYTVTGMIGNCSQALPVTVTVNAIPGTPTVTASGSATFCQGGSVTFTSSSTSGNQWYKDGNAISGATNQTYIAAASGSYTVRATGNGCASNPSTAQAVTVNPTPPQPTITQTGNSLQSSVSTGNQWFLNGSPISGATSQTYSTTIAGIYSVQTTQNGCLSPMSSAHVFTVTGLISPQLDAKIRIVPNPVRDKLSIKYNGNPAKFTVRLISSSGTILSTGTFTANYELLMSKYSAGVYLVQIINEKNGEKTQRLIVKQ